MNGMKGLKHIWKRVLPVLLAALILVSPLAAPLSAAAEEMPLGSIVLSVEKFTLGQGYLVEPQMVPFYEGDYMGTILSRVLGTGNFKNSKVVGEAGQNISYLSHVKDPNAGEINPPEYIKEKIGWPLSKGRNDADWLGEFDYTTGSGWVYTVNNTFVNYGMASCKPANGMVIRVQFTVYNGDITGPGTGTADDTTAVDRGPLMKKLAFINSASDKEELLADPDLKTAYDNAYAVITDLSCSKGEVNQALEALVKAMPASPDLSITYNLNGGTGEAVDNTVYKAGDEAVLLSDKGLSYPEDKFFSNWNTEPDGTGKAYMPGTSVTFGSEDMVLYAIWDDEYGVTYDVNVAGGGGASVAPVDSNVYFPGRSVTLKSFAYNGSKPEEGKVFVEWNTQPDGTGEGYAAGGRAPMVQGGLTLYAIWADGYKVTYDGNGSTKGSVPSDSKYYLPGVNFTVNYTSSLYKDNQRITGWNTKADGSGEFYKASSAVPMPEGGVTLYAMYGDTYTVTYDLNGGTGNTPADTNLYLPDTNVSPKSGTSLTKDGDKAFKEWNTAPDGSGTSYTASFKMGSENLYLYAIYEQGYTVTYEVNGGVGTAPADTKLYLNGATVSLKSGSSLKNANGDEFAGWNTRADGSGETIKSSFQIEGENVILYATYAPVVTYTITYDLNGGVSGLPDATSGHKAGAYVYLRDAKNGQLASVSATHPTGQPGKVFKGWSETPDNDPAKAMTTYTMPDRSVTLYAVWADGLSIRYDLGEGTGETPVDDALYGGDRKTYLYTPKATDIVPPEGTVFYQWNTAPDGSGTGVNAGGGLSVADYTGTLTLYAVYKAQYVLKYDTNGGSEIPDSNKTFSGSTVAVTGTVPSKDGVVFRRWNTEKDGSGIDYKAGEKLTVTDGDITLYARWSANSVLYDAGEGGNPPVDDSLYVPNQEVTAPSASGMTAPEGKRFIAWNTRADGSGAFIAPGEIFRIGKGDMTLYAVWRDTDVEEDLNLHLAALLKNVPAPGVGTTQGEWSVMALARAGYTVPSDYYTQYYARVAAALREADGMLDNVKYTEYSRVILAFSAIGYDPHDIAGYDMISMLTDMKKITRQGLNGPIFALLALDAGNYDIVQDENAADQATREKLISAILDAEIEGGGWALFGNRPDADITAMALQALAPYKDREDVKPYIDRALGVLSEKQDASGRFGSVDGVCAESTAQVIVALTSLGINPKTDPRFVKSDGNTVSALLLYALEGGGFTHLLGGGYNDMATDQSILALIAYDRFLNGENALYDMTDVTPILNPDQEAELILLNQAKADAKATLDAYKDPAQYREAERAQLEQAVSHGKAAVDAAADVEAVKAALDAALAAMDEIKTDAQLTAEELRAAKEAAKAELDAYKNPADYDTAQAAELRKAVADGKAAIDAAMDLAGVRAAKEAAMKAMDAVRIKAEPEAPKPDPEPIPNPDTGSAVPVGALAWLALPAGCLLVLSRRRPKAK